MTLGVVSGSGCAWEIPPLTKGRLGGVVSLAMERPPPLYLPLDKGEKVTF
jgi:hypothetical protein